MPGFLNTETILRVAIQNDLKGDPKDEFIMSPQRKELFFDKTCRHIERAD